MNMTAHSLCTPGRSVNLVGEGRNETSGGVPTEEGVARKAVGADAEAGAAEAEAEAAGTGDPGHQSGRMIPQLHLIHGSHYLRWRIRGNGWKLRLDCRQRCLTCVPLQLHPRYRLGGLYRRLQATSQAPWHLAVKCRSVCQLHLGAAQHRAARRRRLHRAPPRLPPHPQPLAIRAQGWFCRPQSHKYWRAKGVPMEWLDLG